VSSDHASQRLKRLVGRRHRGQRGLTMIELLLALTLLVVLSGFLVGGLQIAHRAFAANQKAGTSAEIDAAMEVIADQLATAFPDQKSGRLEFDGRRNVVGFAGLDQGRANRAGLQHIVIELVGATLTISVTPPARPNQTGAATKRVVLLDNVASIKFDYFGAFNQADRPVWRPDWRSADQMPQLVSLQIDFTEPGNVTASRVIAIRQRS
jgi:general secretion pathway protein J